MNSKTVDVPLAEQSYSILIGSDVFDQIPQQIRSGNPTRLFLIYDANVESHFQKISQILQADGWTVSAFRVPPGEQSKSIQQAAEIWQFLAEQRADRKSLIVAIGGGVVGDLAGFIAATFARGIPFFQIPTTLLAHVDSSVGGKTGINLPSAKNMVGSFWQPQGVVIDTRTLSTLNDREFISGLAEVIKYGLIMDEQFFQHLENNSSELGNREGEFLIDVIAHCCRLKAEVVVEDEKETSGRRAILNYGHTFAHAFETEFGYGKYLHGEAVSVGMLCAGKLAEKLEWVDAGFCQRQEKLLRAAGLPVSVDPVDAEKLIDVMRRDKKNVDDTIRFILPVRVGEVRLYDQPVDRTLILEAMAPYIES